MAAEKKTSAEAAFAANLRRARTDRGLTQAQLAEGMASAGFKWHPPTVYKVENGERQIQLGEALELARILDVTLEDMATLEDEAQERLEIWDAYRRASEMARTLVERIEDYRQLSLELQNRLRPPGVQKLLSADDLESLRAVAFTESEAGPLVDLLFKLVEVWQMGPAVGGGPRAPEGPAFPSDSPAGEPPAPIQIRSEEPSE
ncbi:MAG: helix-turn-helix transcriptional regulator [Akkermansiaceae bacterium]|nr:helix-turn-helix transcriptional regulator [Akkermansiaceae bacterium]